jgi:protein-S-isoprenylcysteine O-methyltransferase Ste14
LEYAKTLSSDTGLILLIGVWLAYFLIHSVLASLAVKRWVADRYPALMPAYRLLFNLLAVLLLIPPLYLTYSWQGPWLWRWTGVGWWLANGVALSALALFYWSLRYYDISEFMGSRQWRARELRVEDQESFHISPLHRHVRHPWYALGLVLIWTRDMNPAFLLTAIVITLYFMVGSRLEEKKLTAYHGDAYRRYLKRVPGLVPCPWRRLTPDEAEELQRDARRS